MTGRGWRRETADSLRAALVALSLLTVPTTLPLWWW